MRHDKSEVTQVIRCLFFWRTRTLEVFIRGSTGKSTHFEMDFVVVCFLFQDLFKPV